MKIGIITFHASFNYGSMLQAWALQTYLERLGHEVQIVNYRSRVQRLTYHKPLDFHNVENSLSSCKRLLLYPSSIKPLNKKWHLFDDFLHKELHLTKEYYTVEELENANFDFDLLICGSDQIWNTNAPDSGEAYYGNWFKGRKIAYAASFGPSPEKVDMKKCVPYIKNFAALGLRENRGKDIILNALPSLAQKIPINVVCDPTLLLNHKIYSTFMNEEPLVNEKYIFYYTAASVDKGYIEIASSISDKLSMDVIVEKAYYNYFPREGRFKSYLSIGPKEFLNLISNAQFVIGGSFHLLVFSVILHKDFLCIDGDHDARTNLLLNKLHLTDRIVSLKAPNNFSVAHISNWSNIDSLLNEYREKSTSFLDELLH